jgi:hypothetical protein
LSPSDNSKLISGSSFNNIGLSSIKDSSAFKKIQYHSKTNNHRKKSKFSYSREWYFSTSQTCFIGFKSR